MQQIPFHANKTPTTALVERLWPSRLTVSTVVSRSLSPMPRCESPSEFIQIPRPGCDAAGGIPRISFPPARFFFFCGFCRALQVPTPPTNPLLPRREKLMGTQYHGRHRLRRSFNLTANSARGDDVSRSLFFFFTGLISSARPYEHAAACESGEACCVYSRR